MYLCQRKKMNFRLRWHYKQALRVEDEVVRFWWSKVKVTVTSSLSHSSKCDILGMLEGDFILSDWHKYQLGIQLRGGKSSFPKWDNKHFFILSVIIMKVLVPPSSFRHLISHGKQTHKVAPSSECSGSSYSLLFWICSWSLWVALRQDSIDSLFCSVVRRHVWAHRAFIFLTSQLLCRDVCSTAGDEYGSRMKPHEPMTDYTEVLWIVSRKQLYLLWYQYIFLYTHSNKNAVLVAQWVVDKYDFFHCLGILQVFPLDCISKFGLSSWKKNKTCVYANKLIYTWINNRHCLEIYN